VEARITVRVAEDGTITVPDQVVRMLRLLPRQAVTIVARGESIVLSPSPGEKLKEAGRMLRETLAGVEWHEIEAGREERCE
jgi:antitoxin component of MazEF toxin-antitoxin module